ncbi:MAG: HAMP domain-containing protein [Chloroflexi bacterium]|nr:HAMP domain-containing protein [Chloroflexota bacterium]
MKSNSLVGVADESESSHPPIPFRKQLRLRIALELALGLTILFGLYVGLMWWAVHISTIRAMQGIEAATEQMAAMVEDIVGIAGRQLDAVAREAELGVNDSATAQQWGMVRSLLLPVGSFESIGVADQEGRLLWSEGRPADEQVWLTTSALAQALRKGESAVAIGERADDSRIFIMVSPLNSPPGTEAGALLGSLNLTSLGVQILFMPAGGKGLRVDVVDSGGGLLASSMGSGIRYANLAHLTLLGDALRKGESKVVIHDTGGAYGHVVAFVPFKDIPGGVILEEEKAAALAIPRQLHRLGLIIGSIALVILSLMVWWHIGRITRPIGELSAAASAMADGSFDRRVPVTSKDELGLLAYSLEMMRVRLKSAWELRQRWVLELEQQVEERTGEAHRLLGRVVSAQEDEQKRVARELHDGAAQHLATLLVALDRAELLLLSGNQPGEEIWHQAQEEARQALAEIRRLVSGLRPAALDDLGLVPAIRGYAENRLKPLGIMLRYEVVGQERRLGSSLESALFRIVQEAVNNVIRHAEAQHVRVQLEFTGKAVSATVEDDGVGFDSSAKSQGIGLAGMRERASLVGGVLSLHSSSKSGTRVSVTIPLPEDAHG